MKNIHMLPGTEIAIPDDVSTICHTALILGRDAHGQYLVIDNTQSFNVAVRTLRAATNGKPFYIVKNEPKFPPKEIIRRALRLLGKPYHPVFYNCQHFTSECVTGEARSPQLYGMVGLTALAVCASMLARTA